MHDDLGQLTREDNSLTGESYVYTYDNAGNILTKRIYAYSLNATLSGYTGMAVYNYDDADWGDLLTSYKPADSNTTSTITYDTIGNPLSYYNGYTFTWQKGRQLASATNGTNTLSFTYNADGIRTSKTVNGVKHNYLLSGSTVMAEYWVQSGVQHVLIYLYDNTGAPVGMMYRDNGDDADIYEYYLFERNLQGDIVAIYSSTGTLLATYKYDAWGNHTVEYTNGGDQLVAVASNPFRYRGYYYDAETGLYYVSSRYYDPEIGRVINADTTDILTATPMGLTDKNLFAYCDNNPVVRVDHGGQFWETVFDVISLGASIVEVCINPTDPWAWAGLAGDAIDLIPFVTGVGEVTRAVKTIDKVADTVQIAKAVDFTDDAADIVKTLDRSSGFTKSTASAGRKIHAGYKATDNFSSIGKEYRRINGIRPDYIDFNTRTIYELKPMNPRGVRSGIRQLQKYNKALGGGFNLRLELY